MVFTRSGGIIRCFAVRSDLYEYLEREKEELPGIKHISPSFKSRSYMKFHLALLTKKHN